MIDQTGSTGVVMGRDAGVSRRAFLAWTAVAAGAATLPAWARSRGTRAETVLSWEEVAPGVLASIDMNTGGNTAVVTGAARTLVIDSKFPYLGDAIRQDASSVAKDGAAIVLVNTHHHGDHTGGNLGFVGKADTLAHENALPRIEAQFDTYKTWIPTAPMQARRAVPGNGELIKIAERVAEREGQLSAADWVPARGVGDRETLDLGGVTAELSHFGAGHTDNDLVVRLPELNVVHTGDLVFNSYNPFFDRDAGVTAVGWIESLRRVQDLCDEDTRVIPGHGPVGGRGIVSAQIRYLESLIEAVRAEIAAGVPKEQAQVKEFPFMQGLGFSNLAPRAIAAVYDELSANEG